MGEVQFADTNESYLISITASVSAGDELTTAFLELFPLLLVLIVVISSLGAFLCSRILVRPVLEISRVSKRMANLDMTWECSVNRTDELGILANSLNNMAKRLDATLKELEHANQKLRGTWNISPNFPANAGTFCGCFARTENTDYDFKRSD